MKKISQERQLERQLADASLSSGWTRMMGAVEGVPRTKRPWSEMGQVKPHQKRWNTSVQTNWSFFQHLFFCAFLFKKKCRYRNSFLNRPFYDKGVSSISVSSISIVSLQCLRHFDAFCSGGEFYFVEDHVQF